jgi:hypothetical protein
MTDTVVIAEDSESTGYRFSWGLAIAGGVAATAVTFSCSRSVQVLDCCWLTRLRVPVHHFPSS